jgi:hypothetical protein
MSHSDASRWMGRLATAPRLASRLFKWGLPTRSLVFGPLSLGDDLLCTAVLHEARKRGRPLTMFTARPELFLNNPDPAAVRPIDDHYLTLLRALGRPAIQPYYVSADPSLPDRDITPPHHIIAEMARLTGLTGDIALRPYLNLTASELAAAVRLPRQIAIHSSGLAAALPYSTKEWGSAHFAALAQLLSGDFSLVQLGSPRDPLLPGVALDHVAAPPYAKPLPSRPLLYSSWASKGFSPISLVLSIVHRLLSTAAAPPRIPSTMPPISISTRLHLAPPAASAIIVRTNSFVSACSRQSASPTPFTNSSHARGMVFSWKPSS